MVFHKQVGKNNGFTLLEILLVVAAIAILAGIVIFAINPGKQLAELRNGKRRADISLLVNAVYQYALDNGGTLPADILAKSDSNCPTYGDMEICQTDAPDQTGCSVDLIELTENQKYLVTVPVDPSGGVGGVGGAGYFIHQNQNGRVVACAPNAELGVEIQIVR
jgi:prepilin-type N-terminal cleavage/methylation domain-containing protein